MHAEGRINRAAGVIAGVAQGTAFREALAEPRVITIAVIGTRNTDRTFGAIEADWRIFRAP